MNHEKPKYADEQIAFAVKQVETGTRADEVCRKRGFRRRRFTQIQRLGVVLYRELHRAYNFFGICFHNAELKSGF